MSLRLLKPLFNQLDSPPAMVTFSLCVFLGMFYIPLREWLYGISFVAGVESDIFVGSLPALILLWFVNVLIDTHGIRLRRRMKPFRRLLVLIVCIAGMALSAWPAIGLEVFATPSDVEDLAPANGVYDALASGGDVTVPPSPETIESEEDEQSGSTSVATDSIANDDVIQTSGETASSRGDDDDALASGGDVTSETAVPEVEQYGNHSGALDGSGAIDNGRVSGHSRIFRSEVRITGPLGPQESVKVNTSGGGGGIADSVVEFESDDAITDVNFDVEVTRTSKEISVDVHLGGPASSPGSKPVELAIVTDNEVEQGIPGVAPSQIDLDPGGARKRSPDSSSGPGGVERLLDPEAFETLIRYCDSCAYKIGISSSDRFLLSNMMEWARVKLPVNARFEHAMAAYPRAKSNRDRLIDMWILQPPEVREQANEIRSWLTEGVDVAAADSMIRSCVSGRRFEVAGAIDLLIQALSSDTTLPQPPQPRN